MQAKGEVVDATTFLSVAFESVAGTLHELAKFEGVDEVTIVTYGTPEGQGVRAAFKVGGDTYVIEPQQGFSGVVGMFALLGKAVINRSTIGSAGDGNPENRRTSQPQGEQDHTPGQ